MKSTVKNVPVILQMEAVECGAASLAMILAYYKKYIPLEELRNRCNVSRDGSSAKYIMLAARSYGMEAKVFKMGTKSVRELKTLPAIIHWNFNHFVVLCGFKGEKAVINDPAEGKITVDAEEFNNSFTGIVLSFSPTEQFEESGTKKNIRTFIHKRMKGSYKALVLVIITGFILSLLELIKPVFYKIFMDKVLVYHSQYWLDIIVRGMIVVLLAGVAAEILKNVLIARIQVKLGVEASSAFMWHILRLPVEFFSQRYVGDVAARQQSNIIIADALCNVLAPTVLNVLMIGIYIFIMIYYNVALAGFVLFITVLNLLLFFVVSKKNYSAAKSMQRDSGRLAGATVSAISMIETIKAGGAEIDFFEKIAGYEAGYNNSAVFLLKQNAYLRTIPVLLHKLGMCVILMMGVELVFSGKFTIGGLMAFQSFVNLFMTPVDSVIEAVQKCQNISGNIEQIEDVMNYEAEEFDFSDDEADKEYDMLSGNVSISNLSYSFSPLAPAFINNFNLDVRKGEMIAFVGRSGSGKSTIIKLISGLYKISEGDITFDGKSINNIDRYVFRESVKVVEQNITLFEGTIRDNVTLFDSTISDEDVINACKDACIHDDIVAMPQGYDSVLSENGVNLSGGQRQRIEIARAFAGNPSIIILDEATSALDTLTEKAVMNAVRKRNVTCFIVAHRLSAVRDADCIIYMENGSIVESGSHDKLMQQNGKYANLIKNG